MTINMALEQSQPGLADKLKHAAHSNQFNIRTLQTYQHWIVRYLSYFGLKSPQDLSGNNVREFLFYLASVLGLSRARLNQAKEALLFLYNQVLKKPIQDLNDIIFPTKDQ
jgi:hypothetical protein